MMTRDGIISGAVALTFCVAAGWLYGDYYVATNGSDTGRTGTSWDEAYATISNAVAHASGSDTNILVSNGTYNISAEILITNGITVTGFGGRDATTVRSANTNCRIFRITNDNAVLDGFTITKGEAPFADKKGAGIHLAAGLVRNCTISNNASTNTAMYGVGVYMEGGTLSNCVICRNTGANSASSRGTGVYITNGIMMDCVISNNGNSVQAAGAGVFLTGNGVVSNCVIRNNTVDGQSLGAIHGGGVAMAGGTLRNSSIIANYGGGNAYCCGGGVWISAGRMENCLVASNWCYGTFGGGGVYISGGTIINCTLAANRSYINTTEASPRYTTAESGAGVQWTGGTITNSIICNNTRYSTRAQINIAGGAGWSNAFFNCCSPDLTAGSNGNIAADPQFTDLGNGNFRLLPYSPCVDTGATIEDGADRDGNPRPQDGRGTGTPIYDMGAYELAAATGYFNCYFQAQTNEAFNALDAHFTASVFGPNTNDLYYWWDFGNGTQQGSGLGSVTHSYTQGIYSVSLVVSNAAAAVTNWAISNYIRVGGPYAYVATNGAHLLPFDTWAKASTSILAAVQAAVVTTGGATRVVVSNGTYNISTSAASIFIDRGITVSSLNGASNTTVWGTAGSYVYPDVELDDPGAVVDGFTLGNAHFGAMVHHGTVRNCIIRNNYGDTTKSGSGRGAGACMFGGVVENCCITNNVIAGVYPQGVGVYMTGTSLVQNCSIVSNYAGGGYNSGGGVYLGDANLQATLRNSLVAFNKLADTRGSSWGGGGVYFKGGRIESCAIVSNQVVYAGGATAPRGGGVYVFGAGCTIVNTIVYSNYLDADAHNVTGIVDLVSYSCAPEFTNSASGNMTNDPGFVNFNQLNFHLAKGSPCINTGSNQAWMIGATDLDGRARLIGSRRVDLGPYQTAPPKGTVVGTW